MKKIGLEMKKTVFVTNGCSNHSKYERAVNDYYSTDPLAIDMLEIEKFEDVFTNDAPCEHFEKLSEDTSQELV